MTGLAFLLVLLSAREISSIRCACQQDPSCHFSEVCSTKEGGVCFASIFKNADSKIVQRLRCLEPHEAIPPGRPFICEYNRRNAHKYVSQCCSDRDYCNSHLELVLNITEENSSSHGSSSSTSTSPEVLLPVILTVVLLLALVCLASLYAILMKLRKRKLARGRSEDSYSWWCSNCCSGSKLGISDDGYQQVEIKSHTESTVQAGTGITAVTGSELNDYLTGSTNSGSGSGLPLLVQRSVARQVCMISIREMKSIF